MIGIVSLTDDVITWAKPLIRDIERHEPDMEVILQVSEPGEGSYAASINKLAKYWIEETDDEWFLPMNADVELEKPFSHIFPDTPTDRLYGCTINTQQGRSWIDGWIYLISREVWEKVGEVDENFKIACFEDADYTWRAEKLGIEVYRISLPFIHHRASPRMRVSNFWKIRKENQNYLIEKYDLDDDWRYR